MTTNDQTNSIKRVLPDAAGTTPVQVNQVYKMGAVLMKVEMVLPMRVMIRRGRHSDDGPVEWSAMEIITRSGLAGADLIAGPGSRHASKTL